MYSEHPNLIKPRIVGAYSFYPVAQAGEQATEITGLDCHLRLFSGYMSDAVDIGSERCR